MFPCVTPNGDLDLTLPPVAPVLGFTGGAGTRRRADREEPAGGKGHNVARFLAGYRMYCMSFAGGWVGQRMSSLAPVGSGHAPT